MADKDGPADDGPSLELPSLGFRRRRRQAEPSAPPAQDDTAVLPPASDPAPAPVTEPEPTPRPPSPPPVREPDRRPLFADEEPGRPETRTRTATPLVTQPRRTVPAVSGAIAAPLVGLVVGALTVGLTWGGLQGCEALRGTSSCGNPGFLLLVAILVAMVLLGSALLRALRVTDPGSTSFLGIGLLAVVALLFLVEVLFDWWMVIAVPVTSTLTFALAHWVTTAFTDTER